MKQISLFFVLLFSPALTAKVVLWDLGGVLFHPNKLGVARNVGIFSFIEYMVRDLRTPNVQNAIFEVLEQLEKPEAGIRELAGTAEGTPLPTIMCHWQAGTVTGAEIIKRAHKKIDWLHSYDYFESDREMKLIKNTIRAMFDPEILAKNVYAIDSGIALLRECRLVRNPDGSLKNRMFAFSNWDHLSFDIFRKHHNAIFSLFEQIVISGHIKYIKPRAEAFQYLLSHYNLDPKECILIDDQEINAEGARKMGIQTIVIRNGDYNQVRTELKRLGVL